MAPEEFTIVTDSSQVKCVALNGTLESNMLDGWSSGTASVTKTITNTRTGARITVNGDAEEYSAYRLFDLTTSLKPNDTCTGEHTDDCYNYAYTINPAYAFIRDMFSDKNDVEIVDGILDMDADMIRDFADNVYENIKSGSIDADLVTNNNKFVVDEQGYYLIVETKTKDDPDSVSLVMLDTAGQQDITVDSKEDVPKLVKKVKSADTDWQDAVDATENNTFGEVFGLGEVFDFKIETDMPDNITKYKTYKYIIHDKLDESFSMTNNVSITIQDGEDSAVINPDIFSTDNEDGCSFEFGFNDIITTANAAGITITENTKVTAVYSAILNYRAVTGNVGNTNTAHLEFSNDPYTEGSTSVTPDDIVKVFMYEIIINKTDKDGNVLTGADFELEKRNDDGTYSQAGEKTTNDTGTTFTFRGLSQGSYRLEETKVPDGYNKADDIYFDIEAVYDTESDNPQITSLVVKQNGVIVSEGDNAVFQISENLGTATASVVNTSGIKLPHTGAFGRAVLLGVGGCAIIISIAAVAVAKKKKREDA